MSSGPALNNNSTIFPLAATKQKQQSTHSFSESKFISNYWYLKANISSSRIFTLTYQWFDISGAIIYKEK